MLCSELSAKFWAEIVNSRARRAGESCFAHHGLTKGAPRFIALLSSAINPSRKTHGRRHHGLRRAAQSHCKVLSVAMLAGDSSSLEHYIHVALCYTYNFPMRIEVGKYASECPGPVLSWDFLPQYQQQFIGLTNLSKNILFIVTCCDIRVLGYREISHYAKLV